MLKLAEVCLSRCWGESEKSALRWAANLARRGHEVLAVVPEGSRLSQEARDRGLKQITVPLLAGRFAPRAALKIRSFLRRHEIAVVQSHCPNDLWTLYAALLGRRSKLVLVWDRLPAGPTRRFVFHDLLRKGISGVIVPTAIGKRLVVARGKVPIEKVSVIPKGFDVRSYELGTDVRNRIRGELEIGDNVAVGTVGAVGRDGGQLELLEAARMLLRHFANTRLIIAGEASSAEGRQMLRLLKRRVHEYHMDEVVVFTSPPEDLPGLLSALDIFVMPAPEANFDDHLAQAMLTGTACIGTDAGGTPEVLDNGKAGLLAPPRSAEGLLRGLTTLMETPDLRQILGRRAREFARENFNLERVMNQAETFYSSI